MNGFKPQHKRLRLELRKITGLQGQQSENLTETQATDDDLEIKR